MTEDLKRIESDDSLTETPVTEELAKTAGAVNAAELSKPVEEEFETAAETVSYESAANSSDDTGEKRVKKKWRGSKRRIRRKIHEIVDSGRDIKFRGPLSYRHLRILAWIALAASQVAVFTSLAIKFDPSMEGELSTLTSAFSIIGVLVVPLFLIANFSRILNVDGGYKSLLLSFGGLSAAFVVGFVFVYRHYVIGLLTAISDAETAEKLGAVIIRLAGGGKFFAFNLFIDLFLCTLLNFFLNYTPKKSFRGKKLMIFRLFGLFPIAYEVASMILKIAASVDAITLPVYAFPFLTVKPPMTIVLFIALSVFIKLRERLFLKRGKTRADYNAFLSTNLNSFQFSLFTSIAIFIAAVVDLIVYIILVNAVVPDGASAEVIVEMLSRVDSIGFGDTFPLVFAIPFVMLFSYTKKYKKSNVDLWISVIGFIFVALVIVEGGYQFLICLPQALGQLTS